MSLSQRRIVLGITGGIAAYKAAELTRRLRDVGAEVHVVMTEAAQAFITPLTLQAVSGNPVHTHLLDPAAEAAMGHIELARWAELILIAPATADFLARLAHGHANDLLTTLCVAARCPVAVAPAMNQAMWAAAATQHNVSILAQRNVAIWGPGVGSQACGDVGAGRMLEPDQLVAACSASFAAPKAAKTLSMSGKTVVITAGPTREAIDPVRFISNHSSGKMGFALAEAASNAGARVTLIAGPVNLATPPKVQRINVVSAIDMLAAAETHCRGADVFIATAAVADYRPDTAADQKMKKQKGAPITLTLVENPDIVATIARQTPKPFTVGFAAETQNVLMYARDKIKRKNLDMIVANDVSQAGIGFNSDDNAVTIVWPEGEVALPLASKQIIARQLIEAIGERLEVHH